jgi:hypothetical protein
MIISIINHTDLSDSDVQHAIRAVNVQIEQDFEPYWSIGATLRLEGRLGEDPNPKNLAANLRGDAILYLEDAVKKNDPLGFHDLHFSGIPFGYVYTGLSKQLNEPWQVTLSHEALELIADAEVNRLVMGPHPDASQKDRLVFHWYEMCDAVQAEHYEIDGVPVSNFVLPLYFTTDNEQGSRNDFLGTVRKGGGTLHSFGVNPGGYVGFYDPQKGDHDTFFADQISRERARIKSQAGFARRGVRYKSQVDWPSPTRKSPKGLKLVPLVARTPKKRGETDETVTELPRKVAGRK